MVDTVYVGRNMAQPSYLIYFAQASRSISFPAILNRRWCKLRAERVIRMYDGTLKSRITDPKRISAVIAVYPDLRFRQHAADSGPLARQHGLGRCDHNSGKFSQMEAYAHINMHMRVITETGDCPSALRWIWRVQK